MGVGVERLGGGGVLPLPSLRANHKQANRSAIQAYQSSVYWANQSVVQALPLPRALTHATCLDYLNHFGCIQVKSIIL